MLDDRGSTTTAYLPRPEPRATPPPVRLHRLKLRLLARTGGHRFEVRWLRWPVVMAGGDLWRAFLCVGPWSLVVVEKP
jgi:hypothetical protein